MRVPTEQYLKRLVWLARGELPRGDELEQEGCGALGARVVSTKTGEVFWGRSSGRERKKGLKAHNLNNLSFTNFKRSFKDLLKRLKVL